MKKIKFIVCFLSAFFLFNCNVNAQELTCIYEGSYDDDFPAIMLVQTMNGEFSIYTNSKKLKPLIDDFNWEKFEGKFNIKWDTGYYDENNKILTDCPSFASYKSICYEQYEDDSYCGNVTETTFSFRKETRPEYYNHSFYKKYLQVPNDSNFRQEFNENDYSSEINNTNWIGTCNYGDVILYFNREKMILDNKETDVNSVEVIFSLTELLDYYDLANTCPAYLHKSLIDVNAENGEFPILKATYSLVSRKNAIKKPFIKEGSSNNPDKIIEEEPLEPIEDCLDLLGQNFRDGLNFIFGYVRIFIPILLIGLGVLDFAKAMFSLNEDEMKKAQTKFTRRVIAAVIVFLIPTLVNLLLEIANSIWSYIDPNSCNIG